MTGRGLLGRCQAADRRQIPQAIGGGVLAIVARLAWRLGGKTETEFFALCGMIVGSQQRNKMRIVSKLLKDIANFRAWREAQSSIRVQEGPPLIFS
jgi:hypothetical protein